METTAKKAIGTLVLGPGYGEPTDKYFELIGDLTKRGYNVWMIDWMGQGGSERQNSKDPERTYDVKNFLDHHRDDLYTFATKIVKAPKDHKLGYMGFSMGGQVGLRVFKTYGYLFDVASLNSALIDFNTGNYSRLSSPTLAIALAKFREPNDYIPNGGPWSELKHQFNSNNKTHDRQRHRIQKELLKNNPQLRAGDPRLQWVLHAYPAVKQMKNKDILGGIITPIQFSIAGQDTVVSVKEQKLIIPKLPNAFSKTYERSKHEIWIEEDAIRRKWLDNATQFMNVVFKSDQAKPVRFSRSLLMFKRKPVQKKSWFNFG